MLETENNPPSEWTLSSSEETTSCGNFSWTVSCCTIAKLMRSSYGALPSIQPRVVSASSNKNTNVVAVDRMCVYNSGQDILQIPLKDKIDDVALLDNGFIVTGDSSGTLMTAVIHPHGDEGLKVKVKSLQKLVHKDAGSDGPAFHRVIISRQADGTTARIVVLTTSGTLVTVSGIILLDGDMDTSSATIATASVSPKALDVVDCDGALCLLDSENTISVWERVDSDLVMTADYVLSEGFDMTHIFPTSDCESFFTLDSGANLHLWDKLILVPVASWHLSESCDLDLSIRVVHTPVSDVMDVADIKLIISSGQTVKGVKLATMETCFEQNIDGNVRLTESALSEEDVYVTTCQMDYDEDDDETFTCVKFMYYTETAPEQKLMKLIARKRLKEAEQLIKLYGLDYNLVPHLVQQKMYEAMATLSETQEQLRSCRTQIDACDMSESLVRCASHELSVLEHRFAAFVKVFGKEGYSPSEWQNFQQANVLHLIYELFMSDNPLRAFSLWRCFQVDCATSLTDQNIQHMLQNLPKTLPATAILDWICVDIIPFLTMNCQQTWAHIINWTLQFVTSMEYQDEIDWPKTAITFCETILEKLKQNMESGLDDVVLLCDDKVCVDSVHLLSPLTSLLRSLRTLSMLMSRFKYDFSLHIVNQETKESIAYRMLDRLVSVEMLESTLKHQIRPYIEYCGLNADCIFADYVKDLLYRLVQGRTGASGWECKIQALIGVIKEPKEKITAVLNLVNYTPLPIAPFVEDVVKNTVESTSHPLISQLEQSWCMKEADNLMVAYSRELMPMTMDQAWDIAKYFIYQDKPSSMEDARKIFKAKKIEDETYLVKCQALFFMQNDKLSELLQYLKSLTPELSLEGARCCLDMAEVTLVEDSSSKFKQALKKDVVAYCSAAILVANHLKGLVADDECRLAEIERQLHSVTVAKDLILEFDVWVDCKTLVNGARCLNVFEAKWDQLGESAVFRLAKLLGVCQDVAVRHLVERAATLGDYDAVDSLIEKFSRDQDCSAREAKIETAVYMMKSNQARQIAAVYRLSSEESCVCKPCDLITWITFCQQAKMLGQVCQYSQVKYNAGVTVTKCKQSEEALFNEFYQEISLPFQNNSVVQNVSQTLQAVRDVSRDNGQHQSDPDSDLDLCTSRAVQEAVPCLTAHGHDILALQLLSSLMTRQQMALGWKKNKSKIEDLQIVWKKTGTQIFSKIVRSVPFDHKLALAFALMHPTEDCVALLSAEGSSCGANFKRLKRICSVGIATAEILHDERLLDNFVLASHRSKWGNRLTKLGEAFPEGSTLQNLYFVDCLMKQPQCSMDLLREYFRDMKLDKLFLTDVCIKFFRHLLLQVRPTQQVLKKAQEALLQIGDTAKELAVVKSLFTETSSYNYEVLDFLLELWKKREEGSDFKGRQLLRLLKLYKRRARPCQAEVDEELTTEGQPEDADSAAAKLSQERLPFHSMMSDKPWTVIGPELHLDNLSFWLSVSAVIGIAKDVLLIKVASNLVTLYTESKQKGGAATTILPSARVTDKHIVSRDFLKMLEDVNRVLNQVQRLESAVFWSHATADKMRKVEEKVTALECTLKLAKKWLDKVAEQPQERRKAEKSMKILSLKLPPLSTQWALMKSGLWSREELRPLVKQPGELITKLYQMPVLDGPKDKESDEEEGMEGKRSKEEAVHAACEEIAKINKLSLLDIQAGLLDSWLMGASALSCDADQTLTFDLIAPNLNTPENNLKRILFLLKSPHGSHHLRQISGVAKMHEGPTNLASRKMAVACLLKAASDEDLADLNESRQKLQRELKVLSQLTALEQHAPSFRFTPESFQLADKQALIQSLWSKSKYQREVVPVLASICLDHQIFWPEIWESILQQMVNLNLRDSLVHTIVLLSNTKNLDSIKSSPAFLQAKTFIAST